MRARLRWAIGIVGAVVVVGYLIGGTQGYSRLTQSIRARVNAWMEPPTRQEIRRAAIRDSIDAVAAISAMERARNETAAGRPASTGQMVAGIGGILVVTFGLMYLTSRGRP
jgi:hypothetical protein